MKLIGKHIVLYLPSEEDIDTIVQWENDPAHWLVSDTVVPYTKEQITEFVLHNQDVYETGQLRLMIFSSDKEERMGCIDLFDFDPKNRRVGIGILVDHNYRGKGLAHEALEMLVEYCSKGLEMHSVYAEVLETNTSSIRLFESVGFALSGTRKDWLWDGEKYQDQFIYQKVLAG